MIEEADQEDNEVKYRGERVGYIRVSSITQNTARQLHGIKLDKIFEDKVSGKDTNRPALKEMLTHIREGDTVYVHSLDRLGRNYADLLKLIKQITDKGVSINFHTQGIHVHPRKTNIFQNLAIQIFSSLAEFERNIILERQAEGIALAKKRGKYRGRQCIVKEELIREIFRLHWMGLPSTKIAARLNIKPCAVWSYVTQTKRLKFLKNPDHPVTQMIERVKEETRKEIEEGGKYPWVK